MISRRRATPCTCVLRRPSYRVIFLNVCAGSAGVHLFRIIHEAAPSIPPRRRRTLPERCRAAVLRRQLRTARLVTQASPGSFR